MRLSVLHLMVVGLTGFTAIAAAQSPELIVETDQRRVYQGEAILYRVTVNHVDDAPEPKLDGFEAFRIESLGQQSLNSQQITIINGQRSEVIRRGRQYNYRLTPLRSGTLIIPAPTAEIDGQTLTGQPVEVEVLPPDDQSVVLMRQSVDRTEVYPMQPFRVTLDIAVRALPEPFRNRDPLTVQPQPPQLSVPWLDDTSIPEGLQPASDWRSILEPLVSRRGDGFQVNNIGSSSAFSLFDSRVTGFHPTPQQVRHSLADGSEAEYQEYRFQRTFVPERTGVFELGPVSLKGTFADRVQSGQLNGRQVYAVAPAVSITVKQVPTDGRPPSWIGAVGRFSVESELTPVTVHVGDPMTLRLRLTGEGTLDDARPPRLEQLPDVASAFRTYEATEETAGNTRTFTYSLRPLHADVVAFPAIPVSWFDVETEKYVTVTTDEIAVAVSDAEVLPDGDIVAAGGNSSAPADGAPLQRSSGGVFANISQLSALRNEAIQPKRWFALWGVCLLVWGGAAMTIGRVHHVLRDPRQQRQRTAPTAARSALQEAGQRLSSGEVALTCDCIRRAVTGIVASWADVPEEGLTAGDARQHLQALGAGDVLASEAEQLLQECDAARYGAASVDASALLQRGSALTDRLISGLRHPGRQHSE